MNENRHRPDANPSKAGLAIIAVPVVLVVCCALGPVVLAGAAAGVSAWLSDLGLAGSLVLAAGAGAVAYGVLRRRWSRIARDREAHIPPPG